ncbi:MULTISPECIES: ABC transporter substrate-binding protein [Thioclava]|uniref:Branched-chain amino acid ABC transporter substrate-binding protein n=1 Tax=Thioclava nitratireducens TaxID=1915078 RepID=A0ABM6IHY0_9RHOB|nr:MULTISPECIES: ABC transporter substrate-binding protein [Thioclava]AQS48341.1 branched-chain amino acid ABC transporter substrate-binding protein [Thioclava nitratireducens]OWY04917.1 branched-chain amino acid ABC transporter substrate-binding protein [Thioclava sp. F1Mire-8]OWY06531.1 branched-chain amino acid ABC transporter substrate-binding protein [Thioclava sp. IC9]OWY09198.1 branched-chain amino acid ABC transporter substrate-binding protein [Thioclava sp. F42-5]OWY15295.1 branched-c
MKKLLLASAAIALGATGAYADDVKMGVLLGFTGPLESLAPPMAQGAEMAIKEVSDSGKLLGGDTVTAVRGDSTCVDAAAATAAGETLVTTDKVAGIMGAMCSGATTAVLQNVAMPNGVVMISPSATSPALSDLEDDGLFFRTAPSDARQGEVMADELIEKGIKNAAVTYTNNDYGKGLADSFEKAYKAKGGNVTISAAHEDGKGDYSAEVASLASAGGDALVIVGYIDQGGSGILRGALDTGAFETFVFPDGMVSQTLEDNFGSEINGSFGQLPDSAGDGMKTYLGMAEKAGFDGSSAYSGGAYDAAALMLLAMQAADSTDPKVYKDKVMEVANGPGEKIYPGELGKALDLIKEGKPVDYEGATAVNLIGNGEAAGTFREIEIKDDKIETVKYR